MLHCKGRENTKDNVNTLKCDFDSKFLTRDGQLNVPDQECSYQVCVLLFWSNRLNNVMPAAACYHFVYLSTHKHIKQVLELVVFEHYLY